MPTLNLFQLNDSQKKDLIHFMSSSPTGDNAQHWKFEFTNNDLRIYFDEERGRHNLNIANSAAFLALACLIETISIWADINSLKSTYTLAEEKDSPLFAQVQFQNEKRNPRFEANDLFTRHTNRKFFQSEKVPEEVFSEIQALNADLEVQLHITKKPSQKLRDLYQKGEYFIWKNRNAFMDTTDWVRFSLAECKKKLDGFSLENLNLNKVDGFFLKLIRSSSLFLKIFWQLGAKFKVKLDTHRLKMNMGGVLAVSTTFRGKKAFIESGRAIMRSWIYLNKNNINVHPITVISLLPYVHSQIGEWPEGTPKEFGKEILKLSEAWEENFKLAKNHKIIWAIRFGHSKSLANSAKTYRRKSEDFMLNPDT